VTRQEDPTERVADQLRRHCFLLSLLLLVACVYLVVPVYAQTISMSNLQYPSTILLNKQLTVSYTVSYADANVGDYLVAGIFEPNTSGGWQFALGSTLDSSPDNCRQVATSPYNGDAACEYTLSSLQGSETVSFSLTEDTIGTYQFNAFAGIEDQNFNVLAGTDRTQNEFSISIFNQFTLTVDVPSQVPVTLDGAQQGTGSFGLQLSPGSHAVSVPSVVQLDSTSRLKFNGWSDGSTQLTRTFDLESDTEITATYVTQYLVNATSDSTLQSGWYDQGTVLQLHVTNQLVNNYRLFTGGFDGWYNGNQLISKSPSASLTVSGPVNLSDRWNYLPYLPLVLIVAVVAVILFFAKRGTITTPRLPELKSLRPKRSRRRMRRSKPKVEAATPKPETQVAQTAEVKEVKPPKPAKTTMYCTQCGSVISRDSKFCKECGAKLG